MAMTVGELNVEIGAKLNKLDRALNEMNRKLAHSKKSADNLNQGFKNLTTSVKGFAAAAGLAFGVREITAFIKESAVLAGQMDGVRQAYERVADPTLMNRLKEATRGTVSEFQLMKTVTTASNFGIALEQLPTLLEFARRRAKDTGIEVDILVEKIIKGIGRKSVLILDDLQVSASQIKEQLGGVAVESASVADLTRAIGNIAGKAYSDFAEGALTTAEQLAITTAELENAKVAFGEWLTPATSAWANFQLDVIQGIPKFIENIKNFFDFSNWMKITEENIQKLEDSMGRALTQTEKSKIAASGFTQTQKDLIKGLIEYKQEQDNASKSTEKGADLIEGATEKTRDFTDATLEQLEAMRDMGEMTNLTEKELENLEKRLEAIYLLAGATRAAISFAVSPDERETTDGTDRDAGMAFEEEMSNAEASVAAFLEANRGLLEKLDQNRQAVFQLASSISGTLGNAFASAMFNMKNFGQMMLDTLKGILQQLIAVVAQAAILAVIMNIINPGSATFKGAFKTILGFSGGLEGRASGGPVNFGQAYLVGERGPELFMPGRSGSIMPNNKLGMMGATVAVGGRLLGQDILISNARSQQGLSRQTGR